MDSWADRVLLSVGTEMPDMPGFPPDGVQQLFVGRSGREAIAEIIPFYQLITDHADVNPGSKVLDFGVGWGRIARLFQGEMQECRSLYLADVDPAALDWCAKCRVRGKPLLIDRSGGLPLDDGPLDVAYSYSVFSHLAEAAASHWLAEIARSLKPGGVFVFTTQSMRFLHLVRACREKANANEIERQIGTYISDPNAAIKDFEAGRFVFSDVNGGGGGGVLSGEFYGWAAMPKSWLETTAPSLEIIQYIDDPARFEQAVFVTTRKE